MPNNNLEWKKTREKGPQFAVVTARIYAYYIVLLNWKPLRNYGLRLLRRFI